MGLYRIVYDYSMINVVFCASLIVERMMGIFYFTFDGGAVVLLGKDTLGYFFVLSS